MTVYVRVDLPRIQYENGKWVLRPDQREARYSPRRFNGATARGCDSEKRLVRLFGVMKQAGYRVLVPDGRGEWCDA